MESQLKMLSLSHDDEEEEEEENRTQQLGSLASSPSSTFSPPSEFSFTVSLEKSVSIDQPAAQDLSPADEIFLHGHLLPLLHKQVSPHSSSTTSQDFFTLPIDNNMKNKTRNANDLLQEKRLNAEQREKSKSKSLSLFTLSRLIRRESSEAVKMTVHIDHEKEGDHHHHRTRKGKLKFDVVKKYMRLLKPFLASLRNSRGANHGVRRSFGNWSHDQQSEPTSMIHSPTYSGGLLAVSGSITPINSYSSSHHRTIEDFQEAIQAAITHCKKSNASSQGRALQPALSM